MRMNQDPFYKMTDEILYYIWDPIGVSGDPGTRDEYGSYLPKIYGLIEENKVVEAVEYLDEIVVNKMGLEKDSIKSKFIVELLVDWKEEIRSKGSV